VEARKSDTQHNQDKYFYERFGVKIPTWDGKSQTTQSEYCDESEAAPP
jgi:hypothetical protein